MGIYYLTLYNAKGDTIEQRNAEYCRNTADTLTVNDLAAGTYYLKIDRDYNQGAYTLSYTETPPVWADDTEPNNNFRTASKTLVPSEEVTGHLGYYYQSNASDRDTQDWYKVEITRNVKARFGFKTDGTLGIYYLTLYNAKGDTIEQRNAEYCRNTADTLTVNDLAAGTYFLKIDRDYNQGAYTLSYTETPPVWADDAEPNNNFRTASKTLISGEEVTGHLGYYYKSDASDRDTEDWYKVEINGNAKARFGFKTDGTLGIYYLTLYNAKGDTIEQRNAEYCRNTADTLTVNDLAAGTYYLKIDRDYNQGTYKLSYTISPYIIGFDMARYNNTVKIINHSNGDRFEWKFGDGATSSEKYPEHTYTRVGDFEVTQKVWFTGNNTPYETTKIFTVKGIDSYSPNKAGNGGDLIMTVYGGGLDKNTKIKLINGTNIITPDTILTKKMGSIEAVFNLHFTEAGIYDVSIGLQGEEPTVFKEGMTIEGLKYPYVLSSIEGYGNLRTGRSWPYNLNLTNTGNVIANGVYAYIAIPHDVEFISNLKPFSEIIDETKSFTYFDEELNKSFSVSNRKVKEIMDLLRIDSIEVDSLFGEPFKGRVYQLYVPKVDAGSTLKIPFRVKSTSSEISFNTSMKSFVTPINLFGSCYVPTSYEAQNKMVDILLAGLEKVPYVDKNPWYKTFVKALNIGKTAVRNASSYFGYLSAGMSEEEAWHEAYIADGQLEKANAEVIAGLQDWAMELGLEKIKGLSMEQLEKYKEDRGLFLRMALQANKNGDKQGLSIWKSVALDNNQRFERLKALQGYLNNVQDLQGFYNDINGIGGDVIELMKMAVEECPELKQKMPDILKHLFDNSGEDNLKEKRLNIGTSVDPNDITGPQGFSAERYINNSEMMEYLIRFENKAEAPLAAQIVNVYDTLNVAKYDLSTFEFSDVTIGDSVVYFPKGRKEYFTKLDMRPTLDLLVGISAKLDTVSGIVHWQFITLDPATNDLTDDPILGFLLPNKTAPEGEGSVSFRVKLKDNLPNSEIVTNLAHIVFDFNKPILTNVWKNTIDTEAPSGRVSEITLVNDSVFNVSWTGSDVGSNIRYYELYCSVNDGNFFNMGRYTGNAATLQGKLNSTYAFCAVPVDSVGNAQIKDIVAEKRITLTPSKVESPRTNYLMLHPNPASDFVIINNVAEGTLVKVYDITGCLIISEILTNEGKLDVSKLPSGIYLLEVNRRQGKLIIK
ncbi:MAG TPA: T9SS type A sorting domain-containing protein [Bacteroidales bacterium]|nr:T9SS type A sorting domain-containing protein [Bacteroidales bacterium]